MAAHKNHTEDFAGLTYSDQAKSINATLSTCGKAVRAHMRRASIEGREVADVRAKCIRQVRRLLARIERL